MRQTIAIGIASSCLTLCACGPAISEVRMMYSEPKPENCDIKVVNLSMSGAMVSGEWDTLGMVNYGKSDPSMDPFSPEILSELRPRFCRMGGEAVSLGSSATNDRAASASYMVLRKRPEGAPPAGPPMMLPPG